MPDYDRLYAEFDTNLMRRVRAEAYGEDVGQHSWVTAAELSEAVGWLQLTPSSRLLDVGCGPGGPLCYLARQTGCSAVGVDVSAEAIAAARQRITELGLERLVAAERHDADGPLPFPDRSFDALISIDVVLHLRRRDVFFTEVRRVLKPAGRFVFTDAAVLTGDISSEEVLLRSTFGHIRLAPPGFNERLMDEAGFELALTENRTPSLVANAEGRIRARIAHRAELEPIEGPAEYERQQLYLETVLALAGRGALSRYAYLAVTAPAST